MLDTIILESQIDISCITDFNKFGTTKDALLRYCPSIFAQWVNNPTKEDRKAGIYKPRLTLNRRTGKFFLKIEFSAPNLLFKNNLEEVEEKNFEMIIETLQKRLEEMGVRIFKIFLEKAPVSGFDPAKNIPLSGGYTAILSLRELSKIDISKKFDIEKIKFRNGGEVLQIYTNSHSFVFYDKINDLNKPKKRAMGKDQTPQQFSLLEQIRKKEINLEVLRMEVRLRKKRKMHKVLASLGYAQNPTFKDIFKKELCQKILNHYWECFFKDNLFLFDVRNNPQTILNLILKENPKIGIKKAIYQTGFILLCKDDEGMRDFRNIAQICRPKTNWTNLKKWLTDKQIELNAIPLHGFIKDIEKCLDNFEAFRLNVK